MSSAPHSPSRQPKFRAQLEDRRTRLESAIADLGPAEDLLRLLAEVDSALSRLDAGSYGLCSVCHTGIDEGDLLANPTAAYCLCDLSPEAQRALERDLDLAWRVQSALLPRPNLTVPGWETHFRYLPQGPVSGDYCDLIPTDGAAPGLYFMLGDVSGKGVAASLLMAHLNAMLRALAETRLRPDEVMQKANGVLAGSTLASHYATMVCGRAGSDGAVEVANAGHCAPIVVRAGGSLDVLDASGIPLGLGIGAEAAAPYSVERIELNPGDMLVVYSDGLTEAANPSDDQYGAERLLEVLQRCRGEVPKAVVAACLADLASFLDGNERSDDVTILALRRR